MCECAGGCRKLSDCFICDSLPVCDAISNAYQATLDATLECDMIGLLSWGMLLREVSPSFRMHIDSICSISEMEQSVAGDCFSRSMAIRLIRGRMGLLGEVVLARNARGMLQAASATRASDDSALFLSSTLDWIAIGLARVYEMGCADMEVVCAKCKGPRVACNCTWDVPRLNSRHSSRVVFRTELQQLIAINAREDAARGWVPLCVPPDQIPRGSFSRGGVYWDCPHPPAVAQDADPQATHTCYVDATMSWVQSSALHYVGPSANLPARPILKPHFMVESDRATSAFV